MCDADPAHSPGDANDDGCVNFDDVTTVLANWQSTDCMKLGDADRDGDVDFNDITVVNTFLTYEYCGTCPEERGVSGGSFAGGGLDFMGIEGDVAAQSAPLPLSEALASLGYNSIGAFVAAISAMSEQARNATIQQLGVLLGGAP